MLKQARLAKGLSLESIHAATKIPMDILRAIEEGYTVRTLTTFYYRGFVKIYAKYLNIDLATVLDDKVDKPTESSKPIRLTLSRPMHFRGNPAITRRIVQAAFILFVFFLLTKSCIFLKQKLKSSKDKGIIPLSEIQKVRAKQQEATQTASQKMAEHVEKMEREVKSEVMAKMKVEETVPTQATGGSVPAEKQGPRPTKNITLTVKASRNSWLRVLADNEVIFQGTLTKGGVETWVARDNLEISGKNLNLLEFEFNGKFIGPLGKENRQVKKVAFTKDGLSIQK